MASFLRRYESGEHESVWMELRRLGPVSAVLEEDVAAVAEMTMMRAGEQIQQLADRAAALGLRPAQPELNIYGGPSKDTAASLTRIRAALGLLPAALTAVLQHVGRVSLLGDCPSLGLTYHDGPAPLGMPPGPGYPDPLDLPDAAWLHSEVEEWLDDEERKEPFEFGLAPDELHKANVSGGTHTLVLPDGSADPVLYGTAYPTEITLVEYLRSSVAWGGFPGLQFARQRPQALDALRSDPRF